MPTATKQLVIVYDGQCGFCRKQIDRIKRRDRTGQFEFVPRLTQGLERRFPALVAGDFNTGMRLIEPDGTIRVGADAVYEIARRQGPFKWLAWLYLVPGLKQIFRGGYAWIAANRHRLGGSGGSGPSEIPGGSNSSGAES